MHPRAALLVLLPSALPAQATDTVTQVVGHVVDALARPIALAEVSVSGKDGAPRGRTATDASGMFVLARLPAAEENVLRATAPGRAACTERVWPVLQGAPCNLRLWDAATVRGRVCDDAGQPIGGAHLIAFVSGSEALLGKVEVETLADADGTFVLADVPLGMVDVVAVADGFACSVQATAVSGASTIEVRMTRGEGRRLAVRVDGLGKAANAAEVGIELGGPQPMRLPTSARRVRLDGDGNGSVRGLPDVRVILRPAAAAWHFVPFAKEAGTDGSAVLFRAMPREQVRGRLRLPSGGGLAGQHVVVWGGSAPTLLCTDAIGEFECACPIPPGGRVGVELVGATHVVRDADPMWSILGVHRGEFAVDREQPLAIDVVPAATVTGRVVDGDGQPVAGAEVHIEAPDAADELAPFFGDTPPPGGSWRRAGSGCTDLDGRFAVRGIAGAPKVRAVVRGQFGFGTVERVLDEVAAVDCGTLKLQPAASIAGVVRGPGGAVVPGARVVVQGRDGNQDVLADAAGAFRVVGLAAGDHTVTCTHGAVTHASTVGVTAGATSTLAIELAPSKRD